MRREVLGGQFVGAFIQPGQARNAMSGSGPVDEGQHMLLVDFAGGVRVDFAGGNGPPRFSRGGPLCLLGLKAALSNRHQVVESLNRLTDNTLARAHATSLS